MSVVQRGLFHRCEHLIHLDHTTPLAATVEGECPVCDAMLPVFDGACAPAMTRHADPVAEVGASLVLAERFGYCSQLPGRGPPWGLV